MTKHYTEAERLELAGARQMTQSERWQAIAVKNRSPAEIAKANENFERMKKVFPTESVPIIEFMDHHGLGNHPSLIDHFVRSHAVPHQHTLSTMLLYPTATGVPFGRDQIGQDAKMFKEQGGQHTEPSGLTSLISRGRE